MSPQGQPIAPVATTASPQGVASVTPNAAPVLPVQPAAPQVLATPAPVATPNFNTPAALGEIANYYQIPRNTAEITGAGQATGNIATQQYERGQAQKQLQVSNMQDQLDPSKYTITKNAQTGGINIVNSLGQPVDLSTYVNLTGSNPADTLQKAGVTDEADQKFITAYNNLQSYIQTKIGAQNGDQTAQAQLADYYKANPGLQGLELGQVSTAFMQQYGSYFGQTSNPSQYNQLGDAPNVSPTLTSANNPVTTSAYENPNFQTEFESNPYQTSSTSSLLSGLESQQTTGT